MTRNLQVSEGETYQTNIQHNFIGDFRTDKIRNRAIIGADYYHSHTDSELYFSSLYDTVYTTVANPNYMDYNAVNYQNDSFTVYAPYPGSFIHHRTGFYTNDVISITPKFMFQLGLRYDMYENEGDYNPNECTRNGSFT